MNAPECPLCGGATTHCTVSAGDVAVTQCLGEQKESESWVERYVHDPITGISSFVCVECGYILMFSDAPQKFKAKVTL
jgi:hypothetical protein